MTAAALPIVTSWRVRPSLGNDRPPLFLRWRVSGDRDELQRWQWTLAEASVCALRGWQPHLSGPAELVSTTSVPADSLPIGRHCSRQCATATWSTQTPRFSRGCVAHSETSALAADNQELRSRMHRHRHSTDSRTLLAICVSSGLVLAAPVPRLAPPSSCTIDPAAAWLRNSV